MGVREQFYDALREEFEDGRDTSFLCRYLAQERKSHPREDNYARLERCFARLERGKTTQREYLLLALEVLQKNSRLVLNKDGGNSLLNYGHALGLFQDERWDRNKCTALQGALEKGEPKASMPAEDVAALHRALLGAILRRDAQTFIYDVGHRKKDRDMAMLDAYCADKDLVLVPAGDTGGSISSLSRQELEQWEALYKTLEREKRRDVLLPIRIDPRSGAGLFLVGSAHCPKDLRGEREDSCYYICFCPHTLSSKDEDTCLVSRIFLDESEEAEDLRPFPSLEEAQKWYFWMLRQGDEDDEFRSIYRYYNKKAPQDCPEELLRYFKPIKTQSPDRKSLPQEGKAACEQDTASRKKETKP